MHPSVTNGKIVIIDLPAVITETALQLEPRLPMEEWAKIGPRIAKMDKWANFALGDWLVYGNAHYGEEYAQGASDLGISEDTCQILEYVALRVPPEVRRKELGLSWYHHRIVAKLEHAEQVEWLDKAIKETWSVREMKQAMKPQEIESDPMRRDSIIQLKSYLDFLRSKPCPIIHQHTGQVTVHHLKARGWGESKRNDLISIQLCVGAHSEIEQIGERAFTKKYQTNVYQEALWLLVEFCVEKGWVKTSGKGED